MTTSSCWVRGYNSTPSPTVQSTPDTFRFKLVKKYRKEFDWNGDVATRVDMRTTKVKFFKKYLSEGMSDPGKIIRPGR